MAVNSTDTTSGVLIVYQTPVVEGAGAAGFSDFTTYEVFAGGVEFSAAELLLHFDGGEASGAFVDSSMYDRTVTANGGMVQRTAAAVFGASGAEFDGVDDYLSLADAHGWDILGGGADFFIEMRVNPDTFPADYQMLVNHFQDASNRWAFQLENTGATRPLAFYVVSGGSLVAAIVSSSVVTDTGTPQTLAIERWLGTVYLYHNGVIVGSGAYAGGPTFTGPLEVGRYGGSLTYYKGDMDEFVLRRSAGPRGANYTVPVAPYVI